MADTMILAIDCGLTFVKIALADMDGIVRHSDREPYPTRRSGDRAEQDPDSWWVALRAVMARLGPHEPIRVIVPTGHMHALVVLDSALRPALPCLTLHDRRGSELLSALDPGAFREVTGQVLDASLPLSKLLWLASEAPAVLERARAILAPKDYLGLRLTGEIATDPIDAAGTGIYDPVHRSWRPDLADRIAISERALPPVLAAAAGRGGLTEAAARDLGLEAGTMVAVGAGDDVELLGATGYAAGLGVEHVGTTGAILRCTDDRPRNAAPEVEFSPTASTGRYAVGASTSNCGTVLEWVHDALGVAPADALRRPPHPDDPVARATLWPARDGAQGGAVSRRGIALSAVRAHHRPADLARALLVAVAGELRGCLRSVEHASGPVSELVSSGGNRSPAWLGLRAAAYGRPIATMEEDPTALGCIAVGLVAAGSAATVESAASRIRPHTTMISPDPVLSDVVDGLLDRAGADAATSYDVQGVVAG